MTSNGIFEVRPSIGKGLGAFALRSIPLGTRIIQEKPIISVSLQNFNLDDVVKEVRALDVADQIEYLKLHSQHSIGKDDEGNTIGQDVEGNSIGSEAGKADLLLRVNEDDKYRLILSIWLTNAMEIEPGKLGAVFAKSSRVNHSCEPNAFYHWNASIGCMTLHALRRIQGGEEISICYVEYLADRATRFARLQEDYGIVCNCHACVPVDDSTAEQTRLVEEDWTRTEIERLEEATAYHTLTSIEADSRNLNPLKILLQEIALFRKIRLTIIPLALSFEDIATHFVEADAYPRTLPLALIAQQKAKNTWRLMTGPDSVDSQRSLRKFKLLKKEFCHHFVISTNEDFWQVWLKLTSL